MEIVEMGVRWEWRTVGMTITYIGPNVCHGDGDKDGNGNGNGNGNGMGMGSERGGDGVGNGMGTGIGIGIGIGIGMVLSSFISSGSREQLHCIPRRCR